MMAACVIDASVAIKCVITEDGTDAANRLRWSRTVFHAADLRVPETGNFLWKKVLRHELTQAEAGLACEVLRLAKIEIHDMGRQSLAALRIALALDHPVYDTTYLALAQALGLPMVTADRRLANKVSASRDGALPEVVLLS